MSSEAAREKANQIALIRGIGACKGVGSKKKKKDKKICRDGARGTKGTWERARAWVTKKKHKGKGIGVEKGHGSVHGRG